MYSRYIYLIKLLFPFFFIIVCLFPTLLPFSVSGMCIIFILIIVQFWTEILDIVLQMNVSLSRIMPIITEYFVDQEKYFYFILLWTNNLLWTYNLCTSNCNISNRNNVYYILSTHIWNVQNCQV